MEVTARERSEVEHGAGKQAGYAAVERETFNGVM